MSLNGKKFKKDLVQEDGSIKTFEYEPAKGTKTVNQQLTENKEETLQEWADLAEHVYRKDYEENLNPMKGHYAKYVVKDKKGNYKLRNGGLIMKVESSYVMLKNPVNNLAWSVQYGTLDAIYVWAMKGKKKEDEEAPPELKKAQKKVLKEIQEHKEEEEQDEIQEQKEQEAEEQAQQPPPAPPAPRRLTDEQADELLKKSYYDEDMKFGRDKLYSTLKANGNNITRKQVDEWLKKQLLYQLDKPAFAPKDFVVQTSTAPDKVWNIDLVVVDGDKIVLNCVDRFSKFAYSRILRNKTAQQVMNGLKSIFRTGAKPETVISDNGPEFASAQTVRFLKDEDVKQFFSTPHQPESNGLVERFNRTMKDMFRKMTYQANANKVTFTQPILNRILKAYNNSVHSTIEMKPVDAMKPENKQKVNTLNEKNLSVGVKTVQKNDISKGDQVRVSLNKGNDKKTKKYRTNWSEEIYFVKRVIRGNGLKPIQYKIEEAHDDGDEDAQPKVIRGLFKRQELQPIKYVENEDEVDVPYEISKFLQEQGDEIKVSYKGYKADGDRWISKEILKNDLGRAVFNELYAEMNN